MDRKFGSNMSSDRGCNNVDNNTNEKSSIFKGFFDKIKILNFVRNSESDTNNRNDSPSSGGFKSEHLRKNEKNGNSPRRNWQYYLTNNHL